IVAPSGEEGLPAFASIDRATFWRCFEEATGPLVRAGLRPMVHTLTFLPLVSGFGRPFFLLSEGERARFLATIADDPRYFLRQTLVTLKMLACFAYFDDARVRERYDATPAPRAEPGERTATPAPRAEPGERTATPAPRAEPRERTATPVPERAVS